MKTTLNKKVKKNRQGKVSFNIPLQVMITKNIDDRIDARVRELSKSKAEYVRSLIVEDLSNQKNGN